MADSARRFLRIHRRSVCWRLTYDAAVRIARRPMGTDQAPVARARRLGRSDRGGQSFVCGGRALSVPHGMPGAICRSGSATGQRSTCDSAVGPKAVCGSGYFSISPRTPTTNMRCSTAPLCALTSIAQAPKKSWRGPGNRALARRTEHQDPRPGRRAGQPDRVLPDRRRGARSGRGGPPAAHDGGRYVDRRQGVRRRRARP